jgi:hypothetical protein
MGRLTKKKIDEIVKLRGKGYTQMEVAQKTDTCLKTVRKYDPGSISGSAKEWRELQSLPERVKNLEEIIKTLSALAWAYRFDKHDEYLVYCTRCDNTVLMDTHGRCSQCGAPISYAEYFDGPLADVFTEEA